MRGALVLLLLSGSMALGADDFKGICTISPICAPDDVYYYTLYVETKMVEVLNAQDIELDFCAADSWKVQQAVDYLKEKAKAYVKAGACHTIKVH
jgi:hypothetical protein